MCHTCECSGEETDIGQQVTSVTSLNTPTTRALMSRDMTSSYDDVTSSATSSGDDVAMKVFHRCLNKITGFGVIIIEFDFSFFYFFKSLMISANIVTRAIR